MNDVGGSEATDILATASDQEWEAFFGATFPAIYAMITTRHMYEYGTTKEQIAQVAVKNHANGVFNPYAQYQSPISVESALRATTVAYPLGLLDCSPESDGAASIVLCAAEKAKKYTDKPVRIIGSGQASDTLARVHFLAATGSAPMRQTWVKRPCWWIRNCCWRPWKQ